MIQIKMRQLFLSLIILFTVNGFAFSQQLEAPKKLEKGTLDNGLTYYIYPNPKPKGEAVYRLFIKSGSVFEKDDQRGLAHFLEHMAFNGTTHFPGNALTAFLESKGAKFGADLNAHTSMNETVYKLQLPSSDQAFVDSTIMILADWAGGLLLDSTEVEDERGVILSEWLLSVGPEYDAKNAFLLELLNDSRYSERLTIGDTAVIKNFPLSDLRNYYESWYDPSFMAVAVVGDVKPGKVKRSIKKYFGDLKSVHNGDLPSYSIPDYDDVDVKIVGHESLKGVELNVLQLLDKPVPVTSEKEYPAYLQRSLLNRLIKARFSELSYADPAYSSASYGYSSFINTKGILYGSVELTPTKIREGIIDFAEASEQLFQYGFTAPEIEKAKRVYISSLKRRAESKELARSRLLMDEIYSEFYVGNKIVTAKDEYKLAEKYIDAIDSLKLLNQLQLLRKPKKTHYLITAFDDVKDEIPQGEMLIAIFDSVRTSDIQPYKKDVEMPEELLPQMPTAGKVLKTKHLPEIDAEQLFLSNGAVVTFMSSDRSPDDVVLSGFRKGGLYALDSTDYVTGLYAGSVVGMSGAGDFSRESLNLYTAGKSASMRFLVAKTRAGVVGGSNMEDIELMFQLLYLRWHYPRVDSLTFDQLKRKAIEEFQTKNKTSETQYYRDLNFLVNGNNYTTREVSDKDLEEQLQLERVLPVYNKQFGSANGFHFVIVGDCSLKEIKPYIEQYIASLPGPSVSHAYKYNYPENVSADTSMVENVGDNAKSVVSLIFQSNKGVNSYNEADFINDITVELVRGRLLEVLREKMGMVYTVGVRISQTQYPSPRRRATISFSCKPEDVDTLINTTIEQLQEMAENPASMKGKLADVKQNELKDFELNKQRNTYWSGAIRNSIFNNDQDWDYLVNVDRLVEELPASRISKNIDECFLQIPVIKSVLNPKESKDKHE